MSDTLRLLAIELVLLSGLGGAAWLVGLWRGRRRRIAELEALLNALERAAPARCEQYCRWLKAHCGVDEEQALLTANAWLEAERRFWRHLVGWQLEAEVSGLARLPEQLHRCLDDRLEALGPLLRPEEATAEAEPASEDEGPETAESPTQPPAGAETGDEGGASEAESDDAPAGDVQSGDSEADEVVILSDDRNGKETEERGETAPEAQSPEAPQ